MRRPIVIVVEDEPFIRLVAVDALEEAGFDVVDFASADSAITFTENNSEVIAGLFTDVRLPGDVDGLELAQRIGRTWPHIALLVTSGRYDIGEPTELPPGAQFLAKPWRGRDVTRWLREHAEGGVSVR